VEAYLQDQAVQHGWDATILRNGFFYAPDAGHTRVWGEQLLAGKMPIVGGGVLGRRDAELSLVHVDDAARAFATAIDHGLAGVYHIVDDEPVTGADLFTEFARLLDAAEPSRMPAWLARLFIGKVNAEGFTSPFPTTHEAFTQATGWEPRYPTYREGLQQVVETWAHDGTIVETAEGYSWTGG
jgi:nucleoside-diphosphate-sugar epimerase